MKPATQLLIPDYRMLAKAFPETRNIAGEREILACSLGYSAELRRLIRYAVLPAQRSTVLPRWQSVSATFADALEDSRPETLEPVRTAPAALGNKITPRQGMLEIESLFLVDGIRALNDTHRSIGIVRPINIRPYWTDRDQDHTATGIKGEPMRLRVRYETADGACHDQTVLDWQFYEGLRHLKARGLYPDPQAEVTRCLTEPGWNVLFTVGNIKAHRNAFVVVGVLFHKL